MMKRRWKMLAVLGVLAMMGVWLLSRPSPALRELNDTRRALRHEGFKLDLGEFDFALSPELSRRAALLARTTRAELTNRVHPDPIMGGMRDFPPLLTPIGSRAAVATWKAEGLKSYDGGALWPKLREGLEESGARLEKARQAAMSGPIRFEPIGSRLPNALLPYLGDVRNLATTFGVVMALGLHDGQQDAAWTNLLAVTCLATAYSPEPIEVSQLARCGSLGIAFDATWSALQAPGWTETQLAELERRWEAMDLWSGLPETAAHARANTAGLIQLERREPIFDGMPLREVVRHPRDAWGAVVRYWSRSKYRHEGSYADEKAVLLYYRDRELELRRAVRAGTWAEMRQLPGVTNLVPFMSTNSSRALSIMNMRQLNLSFQGRGVGLLGRAAEAEARRRLVVTALALERYRVRHGRYPESLAALAPEFVKAPPVDFMDGQPLRYRRTEGGHFLLYSVGLDGVDNGGQTRRPVESSDERSRFLRSYFPNGRRASFEPSPVDFGFPQGIDLVWPTPASDGDIARFQDEKKHAEEAQAREAEEAQAEAWWSISSRRQSNVEQALAVPPTTVTTEPVYGGRQLSEILWSGPGTNRPSLVELLTLTRVVSQGEPETVAFEVPIRYGALTNLGELVLCVDRYGPDYEEGWAAGHYECVRGDNGNCRLMWNTIYEPPGKHALVAALELKEKGQGEEALFGAVTPFVVTNLCQFTPESATFEPELGAKFYTRLPESNGTYEVELRSPDGERLRTLAGSTTNGFFEVHWDLRDDKGQRCTNDSYDSVFQITLPDSGRSQRLRGP